MQPELNGAKVILTGQVGSRSFGTATESSDCDLMSVVIPKYAYHSMEAWGTHETGTVDIEYEDPNYGRCEHKYFELKKFVDLCTRFNPNVIPLLWLNPEHYFEIEPEGQMLLDNRTLFNSKLAFPTFSGYARRQLQKMGGVFFDDEEQNRHLKAALERRISAYSAEIMLVKSTKDLSPTQKADLAALRRLHSILKEEIKKIPLGAVTGRMGKKRKEIRDRFGYDTKFASHTIRLMATVIEFLREPENGLQIDRTDIDADNLIAIRDGVMTAEEVKTEAERLFQIGQDANNTTTLPEEVDRDRINFLVRRILSYYIQL